MFDVVFDRVFDRMFDRGTVPKTRCGAHSARARYGDAAKGRDTEARYTAMVQRHGTQPRYKDTDKDAMHRR